MHPAACLWYTDTSALHSDAAQAGPGKGAFPINVLISSKEYDYHTLIKVAEMAGLAGIVGFHPAGEDYLITFPDGENTEELVRDYKARLKGLENNIWLF